MLASKLLEGMELDAPHTHSRSMEHRPSRDADSKLTPAPQMQVLRTTSVRRLAHLQMRILGGGANKHAANCRVPDKVVHHSSWNVQKAAVVAATAIQSHDSLMDTGRTCSQAGCTKESWRCYLQVSMWKSVWLQSCRGHVMHLSLKGERATCNLTDMGPIRCCIA